MKVKLSKESETIQSGHGGWTPVHGQYTQLFRQNSSMNQEVVQDIVEEAADILSACSNPHSWDSSKTGLVVGYVQSGKTASFTALSALAVDNQYRIVIVISGVTTNLYSQSLSRLKSDLGTNRRWIVQDNPKMHSDYEELKNALLSTKFGIAAEPVLLSVMKNSNHLTNLVELLQSFELTACPVLIVDDEADQASLNTNAKNPDKDPSKINSLIQNLRNAVPMHSYVEYTATPQAPLLIDIADNLSPDFVKVLNPGTGYTGGKTYFDSGLKNLIRVIPDQDILLVTQDEIGEVPDTLEEALTLFFVGVALGYLDGEHSKPDKNRSMLVHPAQKTVFHTRVFTWIQSMLDRWVRTLALPTDDPDYSDLIATYQATYSELENTQEIGHSFQSVLGILPLCIAKTKPVLANSTKEAQEVDWNASYGAILVGGAKLDRGYTVQGLTVTYMPRSLGTRQVDTIQQRARWFGYKEDYLGLCRVFLTTEARVAYLDYVKSEEMYRGQLKELDRKGLPLREWRRALLMAPKMRATRASVLKKNYSRFKLSDSWFTSAYPHTNVEQTNRNREVVSDLTAWITDIESEPTEEFGHLIYRDIPLDSLLHQFLLNITYDTSPDAVRYTSACLQLQMALENTPNAFCNVVLIADESPGRHRRRSVDQSGEISGLHQGRTPGSRKYPGDGAIGDRSEVVVQLHILDLTDGNRGPVIASDIPAVAVWIPAKFGAAWIAK